MDGAFTLQNDGYWGMNIVKGDDYTLKLAARGDDIDHVAIRDLAVVPDLDVALLIIDVRYFEGPDEAYFLPLIRLPVELAPACLERYPQAGVAKCRGGRGEIVDATVDEGLCQWLLQARAWTNGSRPC